MIDSRTLAAWAGMIGPALFVTVFTLEGWLRTGYDPLSMYISELSLGPRGWIQIANFIVLGTLLLLFVRGVADEFREGKASSIGPVLLTIISGSLFVSGPFVTDPGVIYSGQTSWHGMVHGVFGAIAFSLMPVSCFVFYLRFREDLKWRALAKWTLAACFVIVAAVVLQKVGQAQLTANQNVLSGFVGLMQRIALITYLAWIFTFAFILRGRRYSRFKN